MELNLPICYIKIYTYCRELRGGQVVKIHSMNKFLYLLLLSVMYHHNVFYKFLNFSFLHWCVFVHLPNFTRSFILYFLNKNAIFLFCIKKGLFIVIIFFQYHIVQLYVHLELCCLVKIEEQLSNSALLYISITTFFVSLRFKR